MQCNAKPLGSTMSLVYDYILHSTTSYNKFTTSYNKYMYIVYNMETMPSYIRVLFTMECTTNSIFCSRASFERVFYIFWLDQIRAVHIMIILFVI